MPPGFQNPGGMRRACPFYSVSALDDSPKPTTIDRIYHARDIVLADLENPPSVLELAQQVGVSVCTLQRRFQELFGMTVFGYCHRIVNYQYYQAEEICSIGPGTVESSIKQIDRRTKISGDQWNKENVPQVLAHRCAYLNGLLSV